MPLAHLTDVDTSSDRWAPILTLKAKLKACVGKYRMTLARLPLQNEAKPCSAVTRVKQFPIPVYRGISPADALPLNQQQSLNTSSLLLMQGRGVLPGFGVSNTKHEQKVRALTHLT